jgi:hypothetical protein
MDSMTHHTIHALTGGLGAATGPRATPGAAFGRERAPIKTLRAAIDTGGHKGIAPWKD